MSTVCYERSSTNLQENSIDMQHKSIEELCAKELYVLEGRYVDRNVSARKFPLSKRPEMQRLIGDIEKGKVKRLLAYRRDRLARNLDEHLELYTIFQKHNIEVIFTCPLENEMNFSNPMNYLFETMLGVFAEAEGNTIVQRQSESSKATFLNGKHNWGLPYGYSYSKVTKESSFNYEQVQVVKYIYSCIASETVHSLKELCEKLGFKDNGKRWTTSDIKNIITNPTYMGIRTLKVKSSKNTITQRYDHLRVIDDEQWHRANEVLVKYLPEKHKAPIVKEIIESYVLEGLIYCSNCNEPLSSSKALKKENAKYYCKEHKNIAFAKDEIEQCIFERCVDEFNDMLMNYRKDVIESYRQQELHNMNKQLDKFLLEKENATKQIQIKANEWLDLCEKIVHEYYLEQMKVLQNRYTESVKSIEEIENAIEEIDLLASRLNDHQQNLQLSYEDVNDYQQLENLFSDFISKITVTDHKTYDVVFKYPFSIIGDDKMNEYK